MDFSTSIFFCSILTYKKKVNLFRHRQYFILYWSGQFSLSERIHAQCRTAKRSSRKLVNHFFYIQKKAHFNQQHYNNTKIFYCQTIFAFELYNSQSNPSTIWETWINYHLLFIFHENKDIRYRNTQPFSFLIWLRNFLCYMKTENDIRGSIM